jgi:hypothetical protein
LTQQPECFAVRAPRGVLHPQPPRAIEVDDRRPPAFDEARRLEDQAAVLENEAAAVVDQSVLPADGIGVEQQCLVVGGACRQHFAASGIHAHAVRRR